MTYRSSCRMIRNKLFTRFALAYGLRLWIVLTAVASCFSQSNLQVEFYIDEEVEIGTVIGELSNFASNYGVVALDSADDFVHVHTNTGRLTVKRRIDRDGDNGKNLLKFIITPHSGAPYMVAINVNDINDNDPVFPDPYVEFTVSESVTDEFQHALGTANDPDQGINSTQDFEIVDGNVDDVFMLESETRNGNIYPDLKITNVLDYEQTPAYLLRIRAFDGGSPPRFGDLVVNITVLDVNDNQPTFDPTQYVTRIPENATIGTSVVQVYATDQESGDNGRISYHLTRRKQSDDDFDIVEDTGVLVVNRQLDYETEQTYELIVVAVDHGTPPLQSTAVVSVQVENLNDNAPVIDIIYLNEDAPGRISEDAQPGSFIAIISVSDADMEVNPEVEVTLDGDDENFGLTVQENVMHLVINSVDRERQQIYHLTVTATDSGNPPLSSQKTITLYISDTNDNPPVFRESMYEAQIEETAPPGSSVIQLSAYDRDEGNNSIITYQILDTPNTHSDWFQIDNYTGLITTKRRVDCETQSDPSLTVVAYDSGTPPQSATTTVNIHILNTNDNQPIFEQSFYSVEVPEDLDTTSCILTVSATDLDCGHSESIAYSIVTPNAAAELTMQADTGRLCIQSSLDYERKRLYEFEIEATDQDGLSSTANVKVVVNDVNDNYPEFYPNEYYVNLARNSAVDSEVVVVQATDLDEGEFGEVTYRIVSGNDEGLFDVSSGSGAIRLVAPVPGSVDTFNLFVEATDKGGRSSVINALVEITVLNSAQDLPQFSQGLYNFIVAEDTDVEVVIGTVEATVQTGSVSYSIRSGDQNQLFEIDTESGQVKVGSSLDHDMIPYVLLNIQARSGQPPVYGQAQVNITITDVNDNEPVFGMDMQEIMVRENHDLTSPIYTAQATDIDSGDNGIVVYSLLEGSDLFRIDSQTGNLMLRAALDYETRRSHSIRIEAADLGTPTTHSATLSLTVFVQDVNDNDPQFTQSIYNIAVSESVGINTRFANVTATDRDSGQNARIVYSLVPGELSQTFGIFPNDGSIYNKVPLDREDRDQYSVQVVAQDEGNPPLSDTATVSITVVDANDNYPQFLESSYSFFVQENKREGTEIGQVSATDLDINERPLQYSVVPTSNIIEIDASTGALSTKTALDRELTESVLVSVRVTDAGSPPKSSNVDVRVHILDENDNSPRFDRNEYAVSIEENEQKNTIVAVISASDRDKGENATITYAFADNNDDGIFTHFQINAQSGQIKLQEPLDYETRSQYLIRVIARDSGEPPRESRTTVNVTVSDLNEAGPEFNHSQESITVQENIPLYTEVGRVVAEDADRNDQIIYYVIGGNNFGTFAVNASTGAIVVGRPVDYEQSSHHAIQIRAIDSNPTNPKSSIINVSITIEDVNDNPPRFEEDPIVIRGIRENVPMGTTVHTYSAIDLDSGSRGQVRYEIVSQSPNKTWFRIEEHTGALISAMEIDYEEISVISLVVKATDKPLNRSTELFTTVTTLVFIDDKNDNAPEFKSRDRVDVMEDEPVGFPIMNVIAVDADSGENGEVRYLIVSGNEMGHFSIDSVTGLLTIAKTLDRETTDLFRLRISARDHGHPRETTQMDLEVYVVDVNDNRPAFDRPVYTAEVYENDDVDRPLITLTATDRDIGDNAELNFLIPDGIVDGKFVIGLKTGEIRTNGSLDRERQDLYTLTAYVRDDAFPALYDTCTVTISVLDRNDNMPVFSESTYNLHVHENTALSALYTVIASDADAGDNGKVSYVIKEGNDEQRFSIDPYSGQISCTPLDREMTSSYNLVIEARDNGQPLQKSTMTLVIEVLDENDNDPHFHAEEYSNRISESTSVGATVLTVEATDEDEGDNANITYSVMNTDPHRPTPFKINNITGVITTTGLLDRERQDTYNFNVHATDGGQFGPRSTLVPVHIELNDVNDNAPVFERIPYSETISQSTNVDTSVLTISATDADIGSNGEVVYRLVTTTRYFDLNPNSGVLSVKRSLANAPTSHRLEVQATDNGTPSLSTNGVVEITVGNNNGPILQFTNHTYNATILEHASLNTPVVKVTATGLSGVTYTFVSGNENSAFLISTNQGQITVNNPAEIDYERTHTIRLIVEGSVSNYRAYTTVYVHLEDINDNPPRFTQDRYSTAVDEELSRYAYVTQLYATDLDPRFNGNGRVYYEITNPGDVANAFIIEPSHTGIVKTNAILDVETRRDYKLIVAAYDQGYPVPLSSTCTLKIQVNDVNDNVPYFGDQLPRTIEEGVPLGTEVTTVTATDTDVNVYLIYYFAENGNPGNMFTVDTYTGKITVAGELDYEEQNRYDLIVKVSDVNHTAETELTVNIEDINDNQPIFAQSSYQVSVDEDTGQGVSIITVAATDMDAGENARITYSMMPQPGFYIHPDSGVIYTNTTVSYSAGNPTVNLVVMASDHGSPPYTAVVPVQIQVVDINNNAPIFTNNQYSETIEEDEEEGYIVLYAKANDADDSINNRKIDYSIVSGNSNDTFQIKNNDGAIYLVGPLDREQTPVYRLIIKATDRGEPPLSSTATVRITIKDVNDNAPVFNSSQYYVEVPENVEINRELIHVYAHDNDYDMNGRVQYYITSGNDYHNFGIHRDSGLIYVQNKLDHETRSLHHVTVKAIDSSVEYSRQSDFATVLVNVTDVNDYTPRFPVLMYFESVMEKKPNGTPVFTAEATDLDTGIYGVITYEIVSANNDFHIDSRTGQVTTKTEFLYYPSGQNQYEFQVKASDLEGRYSSVPVMVKVEPNFVPQFVERSYSFDIRGDAKVGDVVGQVQVVNRDVDSTDTSPHGVQFSFKYHNEYFSIHATTGEITVAKDLQSDGENQRRKRRDNEHVIRVRRALTQNKIELTIVASVGYPPQTDEIDIVIAIDHSCNGCGTSGSSGGGGGIGGTSLVIIIVFVVIAIILGIVILALFIRGRTQRARKQKQNSRFNSFNTIESVTGQNGYGPPPYHDAQMYGRHMNGQLTSSDISAHSPAASSGRGSAEVDIEEDEEIRMINATPMDGHDPRIPADSGMQDDDAMSEHSVKDHQEYLARLGIDTSKLKINETKAQSVESMHQFSDEGGGEGDGLDGTFTYNAMPQESMAVMDSTPQFGFQEPAEQSSAGSLSSVINSEEEFSGSYNWDYLLDWGPQYQPLADVFTEIARLKDDSIKPKKAPTKIVPQTNGGFQNQQLRTSFPPPIITDAPPKGIELGQVGPSQFSSHVKAPHRERKDSSSSNMTVNSTRTSQLTSLSNLPKSPMSYESSFTTTPLSPDFENSLSPLQQHSPTFSPIVTPGVGSAVHSTGHNTPHHKSNSHLGGSSGSEQEIHI